MEKLVTAEEAARETVKNRLKAQIPRINAIIVREMNDGYGEAYVGFILCKETRQLLENSGYYVEQLANGTRIFWKKNVDAIREDATRLAEVAKEAGITVVKPE